MSNVCTYILIYFQMLQLIVLRSFPQNTSRETFPSAGSQTLPPTLENLTKVGNCVALSTASECWWLKATAEEEKVGAVPITLTQGSSHIETDIHPHGGILLSQISKLGNYT